MATSLVAAEPRRVPLNRNVAAGIILLFAVSSARADPAVQWQPSCILPVQPCPYYFAPLVSLLGSPPAWHGKSVAVVGYARFDFESTVLWLHRADYEAGTTNAVWLRVPRSGFYRDHPCHDKYCEIRGTFDAVQAHDFFIVSIHSVTLAKPVGSVRPESGIDEKQR